MTDFYIQRIYCLFGHEIKNNYLNLLSLVIQFKKIIGWLYKVTSNDFCVDIAFLILRSTVSPMPRTEAPFGPENWDLCLIFG